MPSTNPVVVVVVVMVVKLPLVQAHLHAWATIAACCPRHHNHHPMTAVASALVYSRNWTSLYTFLACASPIVKVAIASHGHPSAQGKAAAALLAALLPPILWSLSSVTLSADKDGEGESQPLLACLLIQAQLLFLSFSAASSAPAPHGDANDDKPLPTPAELL